MNRRGIATRLRGHERGAASLEFTSLIVIGVLVVTAVGAAVAATPLRAHVEYAICQIMTLGQGDCGSAPEAAPPYYEPTECMLSSHYGQAGGSVTVVVVEVGADGDYELSKVRYLDDDGEYQEKWVLTTMRGGHAGIDLNVGAGASGSWGDSSGSASVDAGFYAGIEGMSGRSYEFPTEEAARDAVSAWKSQNDLKFWETDSIDADVHSDLWTAGVSIDVHASSGPLGGEASGAVVAGHEVNQETGERTVTMVTSLELALELGIPLPDQLVQLQAAGKANSEVGLGLTFDDEGNLVEVEGTATGIIYGEAGLGVDTDGIADAVSGLEDLTLPSVEEGGGLLSELTFKTTFRNPDGSLTYTAAEALGSSFARWLATRQLPSESEVAALREQLNERSQITFNVYDYDESNQEYGGEVKIKVVTLGGEVHVRTVDQAIRSAHYYDPVENTWHERADCGL